MWKQESLPVLGEFLNNGRVRAVERSTIRLMPNRAIEIHDSELESLVVSEGHVVLDFSSAYIHESDGRPSVDPGTGWTQHVVIRVRGDIVAGSLSELPCDLSSGHLTLNGVQSDNLIPIPLSSDAELELHLTSNFAESVRVRGDRITLELLGNPTYVEEFSGADWA